MHFLHLLPFLTLVLSLALASPSPSPNPFKPPNPSPCNPSNPTTCPPNYSCAPLPLPICWGTCTYPNPAPHPYSAKLARDPLKLKGKKEAEEETEKFIYEKTGGLVCKKFGGGVCVPESGCVGTRVKCLEARAGEEGEGKDGKGGGGGLPPPPKGPPPPEGPPAPSPPVNGPSSPPKCGGGYLKCRKGFVCLKDDGQPCDFGKEWEWGFCKKI